MIEDTHTAAARGFPGTRGGRLTDQTTNPASLVPPHYWDFSTLSLQQNSANSPEMEAKDLSASFTLGLLPEGL